MDRLLEIGVVESNDDVISGLERHLAGRGNVKTANIEGKNFQVYGQLYGLRGTTR
jgi:hypothetical protein